MKTKGFIRKTVLSVALLVAMVMSMLAGTVMASAETTYSEQEIDPDAKGTVTVTKYIANETNPAIEKKNATGTTADTPNPGYSPLNDATFVLIQIVNGTDLLNYYNGTDATVQTYDSTKLTNTNFEGNSAENWSVTYNNTTINNTVDSQKIYKGVTNGEGKLTFSSLPIGIYILKEITPPNQVKSDGLCEDSLISIPMVNSATSNNNEGTKWLYDIHVFPKNVATDSTVQVTKVGNDGTTALTAEVTQFQLSYVDFTQDGELEKVSEAANANIKWMPYPSDGGNTFPTTNGVATITGLKGSQYGRQFKLIEISAPAGYIVDSTPIYFKIDKDRIIHWNGESGEKGDCNNQDVGDRFPGTNPTDATAVTNSHTLSFTLRNILPDFQKQVKSNPNEGAQSWGDDAEYAIQQKIDYRLNFPAPKNADKLKTISVKDTPQVGITDDISTIVINYGTEEGSAAVLTKATHYTVSENEATDSTGKGFTVTFTEAGKGLIKGNNVYVYYSAKLNKAAVIAKNGNQNTAQLDYSTRFGSDTPEDNNKLYTIKDSANVYTFQYKVTKYKDSIAPANKLTGEGTNVETVQFQLLDTNKSIIKVVAVDPEKGIYRLADATETGDDTMTTGTKVVKNEDAQAVTEDYRGTLTIQGLAKTTTSNQYFLKEVKTIQGYNLLSSPFPIEVDISHGTTWTDNSTWNDKTLTKKVFSAPDLKKGTDDNPDGLDEGSVINKKGFVLPQTGSMGYLLFCTVGIVLVAGGTVMLFGTRKKKIR